MPLKIVRVSFPATSTCWRIEFWHVLAAHQIQYLLTDLNESPDPKCRSAVEAFVAELEWISTQSEGVEWNADMKERGRSEGIWSSAGGIEAAWFVPRPVSGLLVFTAAAYRPAMKADEEMRKHLQRTSTEIFKIYRAGGPEGIKP